MSVSFSDFLNPFDITFISIILLSFFFGVKNGLIKSFFNFVKWIIIFYSIKECFNVLRPFFDPYVTNQTLSDILIFLFTLVVSYILISFINRLIVGVLQPRKSFIIDISFGGILGILRGYIIFVLFIFFINSNFSSITIPVFAENGNFQNIVSYGVDFLEQIPRKIDNIQNLNLQ